MKKNKFVYSLLIAVSFIFILFASTSCSTSRSPVKKVKKQSYSHYRVAEPKRTTTRNNMETRYYIKKQKSKKPNY